MVGGRGGATGWVGRDTRALPVTERRARSRPRRSAGVRARLPPAAPFATWWVVSPHVRPGGRRLIVVAASPDRMQPAWAASGPKRFVGLGSEGRRTLGVGASIRA
jgi:hypothetical protein